MLKEGILRGLQKDKRDDILDYGFIYYLLKIL